jgi:endonuclease I
MEASNLRSLHRRITRGIGSLLVLVACASATADSLDPPPDYYDPARPGGQWLTGSALDTALYNIIRVQVYRSYDTCRQAPSVIDADPDNPGNILLVYNGQSVSGNWDAGATWNREHLWPDSLNSNANDLFNIKPCNPGLNSARGNKDYGTGGGEWDADQGSQRSRRLRPRDVLHGHPLSEPHARVRRPRRQRQQ